METSALLQGVSAILPASSLFVESIELSVVGMGVVFSALIAIMFMLLALGRLDNEPQPATLGFASSSGPATDFPVASFAMADRGGSAGSGGAAPAEEVSPEVLAVITAAAIAAVGSPIVVRRVTYVGSAVSPAWAESGRRDIHTSHRLRKKD